MKTILVIENNKCQRNQLQNILSKASYEVILTDNVNSGMEYLRKIQPDLVLCSNTLTEADGIAICRLFLKEGMKSDCSFLLLSTNMDFDFVERTFDAGIDDIIPIPISTSHLLSVIGNKLKNENQLHISHKNEIAHNSNDVIKEACDFEDFVNNYHPVYYSNKQLVCREGCYQSYVYIIKQGHVKEYATNNEGKELIYCLYASGDIFGYYTLFDEGRYSSNIATIDDCEIILLPILEVREFVMKNPMAMKTLFRLMSKSIKEKESQLLKMAYDSLSQKVAETLIYLNNKMQNDIQYKSLGIQISRDNLAAICGVATESLIRTLKDFKDHRLIDLTRYSVKIVDHLGLKNTKAV